ncbi:MAG TPA: DNA-processing protein DprA [Burkholderiales bacterium]|nr:DNA-processing protein DprA [Burkholderiales bacterium]
MQPDKDTENWLALSLVPGLGNDSCRKLLLTFKEPQKIFCATHSELSRVVPSKIARQIAQGVERSAILPALQWLEGEQNHLVTLADEDYPKALLQISDPPLVLYVKGRRELLNSPALAIVGSRNATPQGIANAESFARNLSDAGLTVLSGLAVGIDAAAHRGGLKGAASSVAVLGTGLDIVYPARNRDLAHMLADNGALVSEFPLGTPAIASNFPRRNRVISGMARGCLVVEAAVSSGSLITARLALEQGREVFAIPGSIHSPLSKGCHALIKQGAKLAESAQDILEEIGWQKAPETIQAAGTDEDASPLLDHLGFDPCNIDTLCTRSQLSPDAVMAILLKLELAGRVAALPGGMFQRLH